VTPQGSRVLEALAWSERSRASFCLPLKTIATLALGGNSELAASILADLDRQGLVHADTMGWQNGWLTPQGRFITLDQ
jgi:hypothetical protein